MDEPAASLSASKGERLFGISEALARSGVAVLYVLHRLAEALRLCRRVTAFRDGRSSPAIAGTELTRVALIEAIDGRPAEKVAQTPGRAEGCRRAQSAAPHAPATSPGGELRSPSGRSSWHRRARVGGAKRGRAPHLRRRPCPVRPHGPRHRTLCVALARLSRRGRHRACAGGAPRRGPASHHERRLQPATCSSRTSRPSSTARRSR